MIGYIWLTNANNFKQEGTFQISVNDAPIQIHRDEYGIAYVSAQSKADLYRGQGFVLAQDRLFQIEFYRALIKGEAASLVGESMIGSDVQMRVLNLRKMADESFEYLDPEAKSVLEWYCEGFNEYLKVGENEFPLELSLVGIKPKQLRPQEIVAVTKFIGFFHSQNMMDEILSLNLATKSKHASALIPLSINLDRQTDLDFESNLIERSNTEEKALGYIQPAKPLIPYPEFGSNNWAVSGSKSTSDKPILCNDPHVDARMLPGTFYPIGLHCPEFSAVGIATPGIPGLLSGRNEFVSFGVTNAYGDSQDLFFENIKGDQYFDFESDNWKELEIRKETIVCKDGEDVELTIRSTHRGPIISDFPQFNVMSGDALSLRWAIAESKSKSLGFDRLLESKNVFEFKDNLDYMDNMYFNYVMADVDGNIAHQATGLVPIRNSASGDLPKHPENGEDWMGFIPKDQLPHLINPEKQWLGTANHDTRPDDYPFFYSNHFSPYYRYARITEELNDESKKSVDDFKSLILDVKNKQAEKLVPIFLDALKDKEDTERIFKILSNWNFDDAAQEVGASVYNVMYNELVYLILNDELPDDLEDMYWSNVYYWNQRVDQMITEGHPFIDKINTKEKENLPQLIIEAANLTEGFLSERLGVDSDSWAWGKLNKVRFVSPIRPSGFGSKWLGAVTYPKSGSMQTLNRGGFNKTTERNFDVSWFSSFRMVADMSDDEKMIGILSGGSASRIFNPYYTSQLESWHKGEWIPYWLSKEKIIENSKYHLSLE